MKKPILEMRHMSKRFDMTQALDDVSLALYPGEVHGLVGENGAGKSTLIKIMTGIYRPDQGEMLLDDQPIQVHNSQQAQAHGIAAIYRGLGLPRLLRTEGPLIMMYHGLGGEDGVSVSDFSAHLDLLRKRRQVLPLRVAQGVGHRVAGDHAGSGAGGGVWIPGSQWCREDHYHQTPDGAPAPRQG